MKKKLVLIGLTMAMLSNLVGCEEKISQQTTPTDTVLLSEDVSEDTISVSEDTVSISDDTVSNSEKDDAEENNTWFAINNIEFIEDEISIPAYSFAKNDDGLPDESVEITQLNASYSIPVIDVSEPDENDNVTYTVTYDVTGRWIGIMDTNRQSVRSVTQFQTYMLMDANTGMIFSHSKPSNSETDEQFIETEIEVDGKIYLISISQRQEGGFSVESDTWMYLDNGRKKLKTSYTSHIIYTVIVPADYNGLILAISSEGSTEYEEQSDEIIESHMFDEAVSSYYFQNVNFENNTVQ